MNELSLFSGAGGGLLGTKLLGWRHIGYVENDDYCQRVLAQRIKDGLLDEAPIYGDIKTFNLHHAGRYRGVCDVITAGFPCQPFSNAGKQRGADDERNMWPATIECIRLVRPRYALLENVPGLIASGYFEVVLRDLHESRYDVRWRCLSASEMGAPHKRDRVWIVAHDHRQGGEGLVEAGNPCEVGSGRWPGEEDMSAMVSDPLAANTCWPKPLIRRGMDGLAHRMDRLKAIGNGQVPSVVSTVWRLLNDV